MPLLQRALRILPIAAVQNEWSIFARDAEKALPPGAAASSKKGVLRFCSACGIPFVAYAPLGGLKARRGERSLTAACPQLGALAAAKSASPHATLLAAMLARGEQLGAQVLLLMGARTPEHAADSVAAAALQLTDDEVSRLMGPVC